MEIRSRGIASSGRRATVVFDGESLSVPEGRSVAASLNDAGIVAFRHSIAGDRGLFCGMGVCGECRLSIDGCDGRLACMTPARDGMEIGMQPLLPQPQLGAALPDQLSHYEPERVIETEVLVLGAGPAGLAAGLAAARAGADVVVVDERAAAGGQYYKQPAASFTVDARRIDGQYRAGRTLMDEARGSSLKLLLNTRVWGAKDAAELYAVQGTQPLTIRPQRLVLAAGAYERVVPFSGWTLPGVMTTGAGQVLLRSYQISPGQRVLIAGNGPLNMQLAAELVRAGATVVAVVESSVPTSVRHGVDLARTAAASPSLVWNGLGYIATLRRARVPLLTGSLLVRASGSDRVAGAVVARIARDGRVDVSSERSFEVDAICVGYGFMPGNELARVLGVRHSVDPVSGGYTVDRTSSGRTSIPGVWAVGDNAAIQGAKVAQAAGNVAGLEVASSLGHRAATSVTAERQLRRHRRFQTALWRIYQGPPLSDQLVDPDTVICRCESVTLGTIDEALAGASTAGAVKRVTRAGMGHCQGRFCGSFIMQRAAQRYGTRIDAQSGFAPQPPLRPTAVGAIRSTGLSSTGHHADVV